VSIGSGIVLFVIGAILAFAVNVDLGFINLSLVGYILMAAGLVVFIIGIVFLTRRRRSVSTTRAAVDPVSGEQITRRTTDSDDPLV
jgi:membrane-bound ClpP family serine protease